jgi:hypothetical protein
VRERLADRIDVEVEYANADEVASRVEPLLEERDRARERDALDRLESRLGLGERAADGLDDVLAALDECRVEVPSPRCCGSERQERPAGRGVRYAVGELLVCPFCLSQWIAAAFALGLVYAPRVTRLVMRMNAMVAISDFLQIAYKAAENRREPA